MGNLCRTYLGRVPRLDIGSFGIGQACADAQRGETLHAK